MGIIYWNNINIGNVAFDEDHRMWIGRPIGGRDNYFYTEAEAIAYVRENYQPAPEVSTAGDLTIPPDIPEETAPLEVWEKLGFASYDAYRKDFMSRVVVHERPEETRQAVTFLGKTIWEKNIELGTVEVDVDVDTAGWLQVNPIDPEFPDEPLIQVSEDNYVQAFFQVSEGGAKYPSITEVSGEGGTATTRLPQQKDMPLGARMEIALKNVGEDWPVDPKVVLAAVAVILLIIGVGLSRR